ncbi:MAG: GAF domain-containing protein [Thermodesulfobacteriota bacterium]
MQRAGEVPSPTRGALGAASPGVNAESSSRETRILREHLEKLRLLYDTSALINATMEPRQVISLVLKEAVRIMGATSGSLRMVDQARGTLRLEVAIGRGREARRAVEIRLGQGITGWVALQGEPLLVEDVSKDPRYLPVRKGVRSEMAVPLCVEGKVIGVLNLDSHREGAFSRTDLELLMALANQSARVIHNASLHAQLKRKALELESLFSVGQAIVSSLDLDEVLERITREVVQLMDEVKLCSLMLLDEAKGELVIKAVHGASERYTRKPPLKVADSLLGRVVRERTPFTVEDVRRHPEFKYSSLAKREGLVSLLSVPLVFQQRVIGVLNAYTGIPHRFSPDQVHMLAALAGQSAIAIQNARLYESVVAAEEKIRQSERLLFLGEMAAEVAHELRNPLTVIRMLIHSLNESFSEGDPRKRDTLVMEQKIGQMTGLVEQILQITRQREPEFQPVDIQDVLEETLALVRHRLSRQRIKVTRRLGRRPQRIRGDRAQLEQMALNLILNAAQAMPEGGGLTVRTGSKQRKHRGVTVWIAVEDTGVGIPKERLKDIFRPFVSFRPDGIGLGLSVVHRIVRQHRGDISVAQIPCGGSRFTVEFPALEE